MSVDYDKFVQLFGTFFSRNYKHLPWYEGLMKATLALQEQVEVNLEELEKSAFRQLIPVHHTEKVWMFHKNDGNKGFSPLRYNDPLAYFADGIESEYWLNAVDKFDYPAAVSIGYNPGLANVTAIEKITDRLTDPALVLYSGINYEIRYGLIYFLTDVPDQQLFLINVKTDENWIYEHFAILAGLKKAPSSEYYKTVVNALWDCYTRGSSCADVFRLIAAITGNAVAKSDETVLKTADGIIETDKCVYHITQPPCVRPGDQVKAGDSLTVSFKTVEINSFNYPLEIPGITLRRNMLGSGCKGSLTFVNRDIPVRVKNGKKQFALFGYPSDEKRFWNGFYENLARSGINADRIFAAVAPHGTVNPCRFLADTAMKYHFTFITIKNTNYPAAITLSDIPLRQLLPPWNGIVIQVCADLIGQFGQMTADSKDTMSAGVRHELKGSYTPAFAGNCYLHKI